MALKNIHINLPGDEEIDNQRRFTTYLNYLTAIEIHLNKINIDVEIDRVSKSSQFSSITGRKDLPYSEIAQLLRNSWFTEVQMNLAASNEELVPYANHWVCVQAYYSVYLSIRALTKGMQSNITHEHAKNLKALSELIGARPQLFPEPWRILCHGNPDSNLEFTGLDVSLPLHVRQQSNLSQPQEENSLEFIKLFLKTTRQKKIDKACDAWKKDQGKKRISNHQRASLIKQVPPTSIFDCLFRLRIRSNYEDADTFIMATDEQKKAAQFNRAIRSLTWNSLLVLEMLLTRHISKKEYKKILDDYVSKYDKKNLSQDLVQSRAHKFINLW